MCRFFSVCLFVCLRIYLIHRHTNNNFLYRISDFISFVYVIIRKRNIPCYPSLLSISGGKQKEKNPTEWQKRKKRFLVKRSPIQIVPCVLVFFSILSVPVCMCTIYKCKWLTLKWKSIKYIEQNLFVYVCVCDCIVLLSLSFNSFSLISGSLFFHLSIDFIFLFANKKNLLVSNQIK